MTAALRLFLLVSIGWVLAACSSEAPAPDAEDRVEDPVPRGQLGEAVLPMGYDVRLTIVPSQPVFQGRTVIQVKVGAPTQTIYLHGKDLDVGEVWLSGPDGQRYDAAYAQVDPTGVAELRFDRTVPAGEGRLHFVYEAPFNESLEGLYRVADGGEDYAFTQFEATSARLAFPSFDEPAFKTPFDIAVAALPEHRVITTTPETGREELDNGLVLRRYATTEPLPTYLIAFAVGPLDVVDYGMLPPNAVRQRPLPLRGVAAKGKGEQLSYALENTQGILEELERYFGIPYPYAKLDIIAVPDFSAGAMENVGAITYREQLLLLPDNASISQKRAYARVHAHELAHQWFGNLVTPRWWDDIWLNESFATWMGNKAVDAWAPAEGYDMLTFRGALGVMGADSLVSARQIREPVLSNHDIAAAFDGITYQKGGGVLQMMERYLGEDAFRDGVRLHMQRFPHGVADVNDFMASLADGADRPEIVEAFESFIFQPGVPFVQTALECQDGRVQLKTAQSRYFPLGSGGDRDQVWQIPFCVAYGASGERQTHCTILGQAEAKVTLPADRCPAWVMPNADGAGYYRWALTQDGFADLLDAFDSLTDRERLALMDSLAAGFRADAIATETMAKAFRILGRAEAREVAAEPIGDLNLMYDRLALTEPARAGLRALTAEIYGPRLDALGLDPKPDESSEAALLRTTLVAVMADLARDQALRDTLADQARAYVNLDGDGLKPDAVNPNLLGIALAMAVQDGDAAFAEGLLDKMLASRDGTFRGRALSALVSSRDPAVAEKLRGLILDDRLRDNEARSIAFGQAATEDHRDALWAWLQDQAHLTGLIGRLPTWIQGAVARVGGGYCSEDKAEEVEAFFAPIIDELEGGPRALAQTLESVRLCAALKQAKAEDVTAYFGR